MYKRTSLPCDNSLLLIWATVLFLILPEGHRPKLQQRLQNTPWFMSSPRALKVKNSFLQTGFSVFFFQQPMTALVQEFICIRRSQAIIIVTESEKWMELFPAHVMFLLFGAICYLCGLFLWKLFSAVSFRVFNCPCCIPLKKNKQRCKQSRSCTKNKTKGAY